jgi:type II secretory ATPase GspE/PulE/Tfp pilus assembly ATPase PilB-like protein
MLSLFDDGLRKAAAGITTLEEIVRVCSGDAKE